jgi:uncharacterized protein YndB with AHSA1/START domain
MTERKNLKRRVRARMEKTGERYAAARRHVVADPDPGPAEPDLSGLASGDALAAATGRGWSEWFSLLDAWNAHERPHREIARHLMSEHGVPGWWSQTVTVGYERARGLRAKHERPDGFSISVSRTIAVPVGRLHAAIEDESDRERLVPGLVPRASRARLVARFDRPSDGARVVTSFESKGPAKSTVHVQVDRLADAETAERAKAEWRELLDRLKRMLED